MGKTKDKNEANEEERTEYSSQKAKDEWRPSRHQKALNLQDSMKSSRDLQKTKFQK